MEVGERYIIEISDVITTNNGNLAKIKDFNALVFDENGLKRLTKTDIDPEYFTNEGIMESLNNAQQHGYKRGYDKGYDDGFKAGVRHQESMMPAKAEPHVPRKGDIYNKKDSGIKIIITYDPLFEGEKYTALFSDGGYHLYDTEELNKYFDFVENRADVLEPIKGVLA